MKTYQTIYHNMKRGLRTIALGIALLSAPQVVEANRGTLTFEVSPVFMHNFFADFNNDVINGGIAGIIDDPTLYGDPLASSEDYGQLGKEYQKYFEENFPSLSDQRKMGQFINHLGGHDGLGMVLMSRAVLEDSSLKYKIGAITAYVQSQTMFTDTETAVQNAKESLGGRKYSSPEVEDQFYFEQGSIEDVVVENNSYLKGALAFQKTFPDARTALLAKYGLDPSVMSILQSETEDVDADDVEVVSQQRLWREFIIGQGSIERGKVLVEQARAMNHELWPFRGSIEDVVEDDINMPGNALQLLERVSAFQKLQDQRFWERTTMGQTYSELAEQARLANNPYLKETFDFWKTPTGIRLARLAALGMEKPDPFAQETLIDNYPASLTINIDGTLQTYKSKPLDDWDQEHGYRSSYASPDGQTVIYLDRWGNNVDYSLDGENSSIGRRGATIGPAVEQAYKIQLAQKQKQSSRRKITQELDRTTKSDLPYIEEIVGCGTRRVIKDNQIAASGGDISHAWMPASILFLYFRSRRKR